MCMDQCFDSRREIIIITRNLNKAFKQFSNRSSRKCKLKKQQTASKLVHLTTKCTRMHVRKLPKHCITVQTIGVLVRRVDHANDQTDVIQALTTQQTLDQWPVC